MLADNSPWVPHISTCLTSRGTDCLCSELSFQECVVNSLARQRQCFPLSKGQLCLLSGRQDNVSWDGAQAGFVPIINNLGSLSSGFLYCSRYECRLSLVLTLSCENKCQQAGANTVGCAMSSKIICFWCMSFVSSSIIHKIVSGDSFAYQLDQISNFHSSWQWTLMVRNM